MYNPYNPMQSRLESLNQQKQMIEQQMQQLQQMQAVPPININNQFPSPAPHVNYDFNGKWVANEQEARQFANSNLPTIMFDNNEPIFYMKNMDGTFKKYRFSEIVEQQPAEAEKSRLDALENKFNELYDMLTKPSVKPEEQAKQPMQKQGKKGGEAS